MAPSPSTSFSSSPYCPYDRTVEVEDYVDIKLTRDNYPYWKQAMLEFIEMQDMEGFLINPPPPQKIKPTTTDQGEDLEIDDSCDLETWKRSDRLLLDWILATLSPTLAKLVSECKTARDVWEKLEDNYMEKLLIDIMAKRDNENLSLVGVTLEGKHSPSRAKENLPQTSSDDLTRLHCAAMTGNLETVKFFVSKNIELLKEGYPPLYYAAFYRKRQVVDYLFPRTPVDSRKGNMGNKVAVCLIYAGFYDVALNWIRGPPELECDCEKLLKALVMNPSSFESGMELNFWQSLIYPLLQIEDVENKKVMNYHAKKLLRHLCSKIMDFEPEKMKRVLDNSIEKAVCNGMHEIVEEILASYPEALFFRDGEMGHTLFHLAVLHRWEKVFDCLICKIGEDRQFMLGLRDKEGNYVLHLAANVTPQQLTKLKQKVATPVLQIQRELQWFKEVWKLSYPYIWKERNIQQQKAAQLFTDSHEKLLKEGEKWMKDTANSCSVVAALIVTIVFAAAITVPGGNNSEHGNPILFDDLAFKIFALSDGFAFFSSSFSVIMFLSILTARFAEEDFLKSLPRRLIFGFIFLFLSIISMMAAFSVTVYLFLGQKKVWILALVTALGLLPVASFAFLQFPLLWKMIKYTYFPLHFCKKNKAKFSGRCRFSYQSLK